MLIAPAVKLIIAVVLINNSYGIIAVRLTFIKNT